jgi:hypothetical protein
MDMIEKFNELMKGFIEENTTLKYILDNPEGILRNGSSSCRFKLKQDGDSKVLGAYGVSRFTNWRFYEISESGDVIYEWYQQEGYNPNDPKSLEDINNRNKQGFDRIKAFGIS